MANSTSAYLRQMTQPPEPKSSAEPEKAAAPPQPPPIPAGTPDLPTPSEAEEIKTGLKEVMALVTACRDTLDRIAATLADRPEPPPAAAVPEPAPIAVDAQPHQEEK